MKKRTNSILLMVTIVAFVLLGVGCSTDSPQNERNALNQNAVNQNSEEVSSKDEVTAACTDVDEAMLIAAIPKDLKNQFNKNFSLSYDEQQKTLIFKGSIYGGIDDLQKFFKAFNEFRGPQCVRSILFQGDTGGEAFKWCPTEQCVESVPPLNCTTLNIINTSPVRDQLGETLFFSPNVGNKGILEFEGFVGDKPGNGRWISLFAQLRNEINRGCVTRIDFAPRSETVENKLLLRGFGWLICEPPSPYECDGECRPTPCVKRDDTNTNGNANNSDTP